MAEPRRIAPEEARQKVQSAQALLVCAYEDEAKCRKLRLEGAETLGQLEAKLPRLGEDAQIIFYCA